MTYCLQLKILEIFFLCITFNSGFVRSKYIVRCKFREIVGNLTISGILLILRHSLLLHWPWRGPCSLQPGPGQQQTGQTAGH